MLAFLIAKSLFIERWLSSHEGDFTNHGSIGTSQGLGHSVLGARALCGSSGRRKTQKKRLSWGGQSGRSPGNNTETFTEPETQHEPKRELPWWEITVGFWMFPTNRRRRLVFMRRLLPRWPDSRASFLLQVTGNVN